jgi:Flp pilus assembly protein TadD
MPLATFARHAAILGVFAAMPASAQSLAEIDQLIDASAKPKDGLALAQSQAAGGALLDALATLDRVLAIEPKDKQARLLRASLLCRVDDRRGAAVAFTRLKEKDYKKDVWAAALAPCEGKTGAPS